MHPIDPRKQGVEQVREQYITFRKYICNSVTEHFLRTKFMNGLNHIINSSLSFLNYG
jgi:hypothetical protein